MVIPIHWHIRNDMIITYEKYLFITIMNGGKFGALLQRARGGACEARALGGTRKARVLVARLRLVPIRLNRFSMLGIGHPKLLQKRRSPLVLTIPD